MHFFFLEISKYFYISMFAIQTKINSEFVWQSMNVNLKPPYTRSISFDWQLDLQNILKFQKKSFADNS